MGKRADAGNATSPLIRKAHKASVSRTRGATSVAAQLRFSFSSGPL